MAKKKESPFKGKVKRTIEKSSSERGNYGYLKLPAGVSMFKPEDGVYKIDIIPYRVSEKHHPDSIPDEEIVMVGDPWYKRPFKIHRNIGPEKETVVCLTSIGKKCPICEELAAMRADKDSDEDAIKALIPSSRILYVVIPKEHKKLEEEPMIFDISYHLFQKALEKEVQENDDYEVFMDLEDGLTLKVRFETEKLGKNEFIQAGRIDFIERDEAYDEDIIDEVPNLDEVLQIKTYDDLKKLFYSDGEEEEEEDERPKKSFTKKKAKVEEEEEEDEDDEDEKPVKKSFSKKKQEDDEDEDDEEEEKPKLTRSKKSVKKPEPEEEEDEDDLDEEKEEEKPTKKPGKSEKSPSVKNSKTSSKDECPHGHKFGRDCEKYKECDDCPLWDACIDKQEELNGK